MMSQHAVPILTVSGFFCLAATVKDLKIQRDMCCVTATSYACILAKRVLIDIPTFGYVHADTDPTRIPPSHAPRLPVTVA